MPRKSGIRNREQQKTRKENYDKIRRLLIAYGANSYKEIAEKTGLHRNTVGCYMKLIKQKEKFRRDRNGIMYIEADWIKATPKLLRQIFMAKNITTTYTYRLHPEDLNKEQKLITEGETKGRERGAIYIFTEPEMRTPISCGIVNLHENQFLFENPYWLRDIFRYALRENMVDKRYSEKNIGDITNEALDSLWSRLFGATKVFVVAFSINPQELLEWIKGEGRNDFRRALPKEVCTQLYREASELWKQREELDKRLRSSGLEKRFEK